MYEVISHCSVYLHFSDDLWCWASFHIPVGLCMSSLEKCLFKSIVYFLMSGFLGVFLFACFFLLLLSCMSSLYILDVKSSDTWFVNISPITYLALFLSSWLFLLLFRRFLFYIILFVYFFFFCLSFWCQAKLEMFLHEFYIYKCPKICTCTLSESYYLSFPLSQ